MQWEWNDDSMRYDYDTLGILMWYTMFALDVHANLVDTCYIKFELKYWK